MKKSMQKTAGRRSGRGLLSYAGSRKLAERMIPAFLCMLIVLSLPAMQVKVRAEEGYDEVAGTSAMGKTEENLASYGMTPISGNMIKDGEYVVSTECSSSFFHIEQAKLTVKDGKMTALLTMSSSSYQLVYPGTAEEAAAAPYEEYIPSVEIDTWDTFTIPVEALDTELDLAAFSKRKKKWYPRKILFHASDIPADCLLFEYPDYDRINQALALYNEENENADSAEYDAGGITEDSENESADAGKNAVQTGSESEAQTAESFEPQALQIDMPDGDYSIEVSLAGGSGRASVTTPTWMSIENGNAYARLLWSSSYYDYMILDGKKYLNETTDGGTSSFTIPITAMDEPVEIIADTTAMGDPVEIEYTLTFYEDTIGSKSRVPQEGAMRVLAGAAIFIIVGGIVNYFVKKSRQ